MAFSFPSPPKPDLPETKVDPENLFESYPHATLALMSAGCGFIAVTTLFIELWTTRAHALMLDIPVSFISVPIGVATVVLAGLVARENWKYAVPAIALGGIYWLSHLIWIIA